MATEDERILRQVRHEVTELRKLGEDWGMTPIQINECINEAFRQKLTIEITDKIAEKIQRGTKWSKIRFAFRLWLAFIIAIFGFTIMVTHTDYVGDAVSKSLQPYGYPIMRMIRLISLPLHNKYNISSYHNAECFITNPYFSEEAYDECMCQGTSKVRVTKLKKDKELGSQFFLKPILFKGLQNEAVPLEKVIRLVQDEYETLKDPALKVVSTVNWITTVGDLNDDDLESKIHEAENFIFKWDSRRIKTSQILRKLFPRPVVYPQKFEINILKCLFITGPNAKGMKINENVDSDNLFYVQGWGSSTLTFIPPYGCEEECDGFDIKLMTGDVLAFPNNWSVELEENGDEINVSFLGGVV